MKYLTTQGHEFLADSGLIERYGDRWYKSSRGYIVRNIMHGSKRTVEYLHRVIMRPTSGLVVDHVNGNTLDNRACNLRVCTHSENLRNQGKHKDNTSGFKGVTWHKGAKKWKAAIQVENKVKHLGLFASKEDAYEAYCAACKKLHGEFINLGK